MINQKFFLISSERSGTNLLRAIVSSHSQIASPPPFSMVDILANRYFLYESLEGKKNFKELIQDSIDLTQVHLNPWGKKFSVSEVQNKLNSNSFWGIFDALNMLFANSEGKAHWFSKEPSLYKHIFELALHFPNAKFIYLVRDPRDVVLSLIKGGVHEHNICNAAIRWKKEQEVILNAYVNPILKRRIFLLKYEELLDDQENITKKLMNFMGIEFEVNQLKFYQNENVIQHSNKSEFWQNVSKPINKQNTGKYSQFLSAKQVHLIESICWDEMKTLGYLTENITPRIIPVWLKVISKIDGAFRKKIKQFDRSDETKRHKKRVLGVRSIKNRKFF